jgi:hypothetical protein
MYAQTTVEGRFEGSVIEGTDAHSLASVLKLYLRQV